METLETGNSAQEHVEGESRHLDAVLRRLDLAREAEELRQGEPWQTNGHNAKTLAKYPNLRVVLLAFREGARMGEHRAPGQLTLHVLSGEVQLRLPEQIVDVSAGSLLTLEGSLLHDLEARRDSVVLLTLSWPASASGAFGASDASASRE
jgi:quercetin dioxygenase-like cupin family protein